MGDVVEMPEYWKDPAYTSKPPEEGGRAQQEPLAMPQQPGTSPEWRDPKTLSLAELVIEAARGSLSPGDIESLRHIAGDGKEILRQTLMLYAERETHRRLAEAYGEEAARLRAENAELRARPPGLESQSQ